MSPRPMLRPLLLIAVGALAALATSAPASASRNPLRRGATVEPPPPPPYMELAQAAIVAGDIDAALRVLGAAKACWAERFEGCGFAQVDFDSLAGVIYLERGEPAKAAAALERVVAAQPNRTMAWFYLGQARLSLERFAEAAEALTAAEPVGAELAQYHGMLVRAWRGAGEAERARQALAVGLERFPRDPALLYAGVELFLDEGLFGAATDLARRHALVGGERAALAFIIVAERLRAGGWLQDAAVVLEEARLLTGADGDAAARLAWVYAEAGQALSAARLFEALAARAPRYAQQASEQHRLAGRTHDALRLAERIPDDRARLGQIAAVHLQDGAFDAALAVLRRADEAGLLDAEGRYRMAYAAFRTGDLSLAAALLADPKTPHERRLREAVRQCEAQPWDCWQ